MRNFSCLLILIGASLALVNPCALTAQQTKSPAPDIPVMDGEAGPCSIEFTVTEATGGKPVYAALIKVKIAYGFAGIRKLELSAYTNTEGKVRFIGIPASVHKPPLEFRAAKDQLTGVATWNPEGECKARHDIVMDVEKAKKPAGL